MGEAKSDAHTFVCGSDNVISTLMGINKGYYSWDIICMREDNMIFYDIRTDTDHIDTKENMLDL
jgi:translation initiation factor 3 subunit D